MNNNEFYNANNYYLIDIFNGKIEKKYIKFKYKEISSSKKAKEVIVESKKEKKDDNNNIYLEDVYHKAYVKKTNNNYSDNLDIINSEIATLLNISASKVFYLETDTKIRGIINIDVTKEDEQEIRVDKLFDHVINLIKNGTITNKEFLEKYFKALKSDANNLISDEINIKSTIEIFIYIMDLYFKFNEKEKNNLIKSYIRMIYFDLISGNTFRNFDTYSILLDKDNKFKRFAPIYDFNNEIKVDKYYVLNEVFINKDTLFKVIYKNYYPYIKEISRGLFENHKTYVESINLIINSNIDDELAKIVKKNYMNNLDTIKSLESIHQENFGETKLDSNMTKTSINLSAINNNQVVRQKYGNYNRKLEQMEEEHIKISVEKPKKKSNTKSIIVFIVSILLLVGIAACITYFIVANR